MLNVIDRRWREHLYEMDSLRDGIGLRAYGQRDPLVEYQREAYDMFQRMQDGIKAESLAYIFHASVQRVEEAEEERRQAAPREPVRLSSAATEEVQTTRTQARRGEKVGRNQPCPCGSGKKYKLCHGRSSAPTTT
jgi:preprotein translocase subunit SecA